MQFRKMKTTSEARAYAVAIEQGVKIRAKRNPNNLPNEYDDIQRWAHRPDRYKNKRR